MIYPDILRLITKIRLVHPLAGFIILLGIFRLLGYFTLKAKRDVFTIAKLQNHVNKTVVPIAPSSSKRNKREFYCENSMIYV